MEERENTKLWQGCATVKLCTAGERANCYHHCGNLTVSAKVNTGLPMSSNSTPSNASNRHVYISLGKACTRMFRVALFIKLPTINYANAHC